MDVVANKSEDETKTAVKQTKKTNTEYVQDKAATVYGMSRSGLRTTRVPV